MALTEPVIDVSEHQGDIDFDVCAAGGVPYSIVRAGIGGRFDFKVDRNVLGFKSVGIKVPALYWFINPKSSYTPEQQGNLARQICEKHSVPTMMLDCEWYTNEGGPNPAIAGYDYNQWCQRFIDQLTDVTPIIYTSATFWDSWGGDGADFGHLDTIIADYRWQGKTNDPIAQGVPPDQWDDAVFSHTSRMPRLPIGWDDTVEGWQFSAGLNKQGPVYGMQSNDLDLNVGDPAAIARWMGNRPYVPQEVDPDMRWFIFNTEPFPAFANDWGEQQTYPDDPTGTWPANWLRFEVLPGGKQHVTGPEWSSLFPDGQVPADKGVLEGWTTGRIQNMPNVRHPSATVDIEAVAQRVRAVFGENPLK